MLKLFFFFLIFLTITQCQFSAQKELNTSKLFPNLTNFPGKFYAGYATVTHGRQYYYWVMQNQNLTQTGPSQQQFYHNFIQAIMWMNGGPGCSSFEGATLEVGPIILPRMVSVQGSYPQFSNQECSWNSIGNLIFVEFPGGVGFSTKPDNYPQNDYTTALDNRIALQQIFEKFQLWNSDFYIIGESYAGVYVPSLALEIDRYNSDPSTTQPFPLKGFSTGNGCTHPQIQCEMNSFQFWPLIQQLYDQGKVSEEIFQNYMGTCFLNNDIMTPMNTDECNEITNTIFTSAGCNYYADPPYVNLYDLYRACQPTQGPNGIPQVSHKQVQFMSRLKKRQNNQANNNNEQNAFVVDPNDPCCDNTALYNFLNDKNLWPDLNIDSSLYSSDFAWHDCAETLTFTITNGSYWIYEHLINRGYKIFIYSGNTDLCVPITGTRKWISLLRQELNLQIIEPMRPWYIPGNTTSEPQLGGFVEQYQGLTFVEVQGVGHMVPEWARAAAWEMVYSLVNGQDLPTYQQLSQQ